MAERRGTKALEQWCRRMTDGYPGVKIDNMTTSWRDGLAFCAIIHHFRPDLIEFEKLNKTDIYYNNELAFTTAEKYLGIPALLDAVDMADYEVPDRLSILTYLSQFYQVFAHTDAGSSSSNSSSSLKRASAGNEQAQKTKTNGPPAKMAHVVGVPRRDPCQKCQLPVFLAERLLVGKQVYHRTCLKCARCGSQLTPGSFYETEVNNEFCCETCPDEEDQFKMETAEPLTVSAASTVKAARNSLSERLAFFEQNSSTVNGRSNGSAAAAAGSGGHKVLQKSVSDEEKRQRINAALEDHEQQAAASVKPATVYRSNAALSSFLQGTVDEADTGSTNSTPSSEVAQPPVASKRFTTSARLSLQPAAMAAVSKPAELVHTPEEIETTARLTNVSEQLRELQAKQEEQAVSEPLNEPEPELEAQPEPEPPQPPAEPRLELESSETPAKLSVETQPADETVPEVVAAAEEEVVTIEATVESTVAADMEVVATAEILKDDVSDEVPLKLNVESSIETAMELSNVKPSEQQQQEEHAQQEQQTQQEEQVQQLQETQPDNQLEPQLEQSSNGQETSPKPVAAAAAEISIKVTSEAEEEEEVLKSATTHADSYPEDLNPFASDDDNDEVGNAKSSSTLIEPKPVNKDLSADSLNPFDSSDDEVELEKQSVLRNESKTKTLGSGGKVPPPRPPPPCIVRNPFDEAEAAADATQSQRRSSLTLMLGSKMPLPAPRTSLSQSQTPTPEPTPRLSQRNAVQDLNSPYDSNSSLATPGHNQSLPLQRGSDMRGSSNSLSSSAGGTVRSRKSRRAPVPPCALKELFPSAEEHSNMSTTYSNSNSSLNSSLTPASSRFGSPKTARKKRPAPAPPKPARLEQEQQHVGDSKNSLSYPLQSDLDSCKMSDEEKALLEGKPELQGRRRIIPIDECLLDDADADAVLCASNCADDQKQRSEECNVVYRRVLVPPPTETPTHDGNPLLAQLAQDEMAQNRQLEKLKDNKEAQNRTRQSSGDASGGDASSPTYYDKSTHGKWKRRKGPAPALPIPPRKVLQMLPLQEIRHELEIIEVQQQGLEKQGVILEKMIRDRCEGATQTADATAAVAAAAVDDAVDSGPATPAVAEPAQNSKEVEDLILQLFELVNEKNELFRRQAELMYLRRQHRLEQEQADIEYEIRVLMGQPERNKTDTDKAREEVLIARLVEVVELRNEVIDCLEMDRLREAEEDLSIKQRLELHNAKREASATQSKSKTSGKLSKKEKKQLKEVKKLSKSKKLDVDKDADESELKLAQEKTKKKRKLFF